MPRVRLRLLLCRAGRRRRSAWGRGRRTGPLRTRTPTSTSTCRGGSRSRPAAAPSARSSPAAPRFGPAPRVLKTRPRPPRGRRRPTARASCSGRCGGSMIKCSAGCCSWQTPLREKHRRRQPRTLRRRPSPGVPVGTMRINTTGICARRFSKALTRSQTLCSQSDGLTRQTRQTSRPRRAASAGR